MITVKEKIRLVESCFGEPKIMSDNKNVVVFCPVCKSMGKVKKKLAIDLETGVYHCWVCESKGNNIGSIARKYARQKKAANLLYNYFKKGKKNGDVREPEKKDITLPEDFRLIGEDRSTRSRPARAYLKNRGLTEKDVCRFRIGISEKYGFKNRVIFPSFDVNQKLNYYTARSIDPDNKKRYYNCNTSRKNVIFNEFDLNYAQPLVLVEGVFDLINTPINSTCILGSWLDQKYDLFKKIVKHQTPVTLCFDPDAKSKTQKIAKLLHEYCIDVKISQHQNKDFGDMNKDEINYYLKTAKPYDNVDRVTYLIKGIRSGSIF